MGITNIPETHRFAPPAQTFAGAMVALALAVGSSYADHAPTSRGTRGLGPGISNHPVRVVPTTAVSIPTGWPLDDRGAITCLTCHVEIPAGMGGSDPRLRRVESQEALPGRFCATCHHQSAPRNDRSVHRLALGVAHVGSGSANLITGGPLDSHSLQCLSCHDGASATDSANMTPGTPQRGYLDGEHHNHPVGVRYQRPSRAKDASPLHPASLLPRQVNLPDGKVSCISCHNLYAGSRYLLTVPIQGSRLCLTCHDR